MNPQDNQQNGVIQQGCRAWVDQLIAQMFKLMHQPDRLKLGGEMRELSIMFCDIRDFTALSEKLDPLALTHLINEATLW